VLRFESLFSDFSSFVESRHLLPLKFRFFFSFLASLFKMTQQEPSTVPPSDSSSVSSPSSVPPITPTPPPSASVYKSLYRWAPVALLNEKSSFTSLASITAYRKKPTCHKSHVFGQDHDKFVSMVACREGESVCADESSDPEGPLCFIYSTVF